MKKLILTIFLFAAMLCFTKAQNVGIGTTTPNAQLHIKYTLSNTSTGTPALILDNPSGGTQTSLQLHIDGAEKGRIRADNSGSIYYASSGSGGHFFKGNTDLSDLMMIAGTGDVGIGTFLPSARLHVSGSSNDMLLLESSSVTGTWLKLQNTSTGGNNYSIISTGISNGEGAGKLLFNAPSGQMVYTENGRLGIGEMFPSEKLDVNGKIKTSQLQITSGAANGYVLQSDASGNASWVNANTLSIIETDPKVGTLTANYMPKWGGTTLNNGLLYDDGTRLMKGTINPQYGNNFNYSGFTIAATTTENPDINLLSTENSQFSSYINFGKGRGESFSSPDVVLNNDQLMVITANGYSGTAWLSSATIQCNVDGTPTTTSVPGRLVFNTTQAGSAGSVERMRITSSGNVGIGTTSPTKKLEVSGTTKTDSLQAVNIKMSNGATSGYVLQSDASGNGTWASLSSAITAGTGLSWSGTTLNSVWTASGSDIHRINGSVGLGTSSPIAKLHVASSSNTVGYLESSATNGTWFSLYNSSSGGMDWHLISAGSSNSEGAGNLLFRSNGNVRMVLQSSSGNLGVGTTSPSSRLHVYNASGSSAITSQSTTANAYLNLNNGGSGFESAVTLFTNSSQRWSFGKSNTAESGSDAGSDFFFNRYNDAGTFQSQPIVIKRSTGYVGINQGNPGQQLDVNGNINISSSNGYYIGSSKVLSINGTDNLFAGVSAGSSNTGSSNTFVGSTAGQSNTGGHDNTVLGFASLNGNTTGNYNTALGSGAGVFASGSTNVFVGYGAGTQAGSGNIMLGYSAGGSETGSNKLYIDNSNTSSPLIYGDFSADSMSVNGSLNIAGAMGLKVKASQVAGTNNPNATGGIWIYSSGTGTISLTGAAYTDRVLIILNNTGATRTISSYRDLSNTAQTTIANSVSLWLVYDGTNWRQIK